MKHTISNAEKSNVAQWSFEQWCSDDADLELEIYNSKNNTSLTFASEEEQLEPFYVWLYDNGLNENN